jgi:hypothetical protein
VEARERQELGLAVPAVQVEHHLLARLPATRGPVGDDPRRLAGGARRPVVLVGVDISVVVNSDGQSVAAGSSNCCALHMDATTL